MLFFYVLLGRAQRDVAERAERLSEAQRVLTLEQLERQRAERELSLQQERNEFLEARNRMVEELAAAKEAAEAANLAKTRYIVGPDAKRRARVERLPDRLRDKLLTRFLFGS